MTMTSPSCFFLARAHSLSAWPASCWRLRLSKTCELQSRCVRTNGTPFIVVFRFDRASSILDYDLLKICLEGPKSTLDQTLYSQPAIVVTSLAAVEKLFASNPSAIEDCVATAGFSVGEITALIFSGALTFDDGIRFVRARAEAMQHCSDMVESGMMSIFFGADANVGQALVVAKKWAKEKHGLENPVCQIANYLYAGGKTIAGHKEVTQS